MDHDSVTTGRNNGGKTRHPVVVVVGGGVSGAGVAYHLVRTMGEQAPAIVVFEPRSELGRGLAYDTTDPAHRINVPAARMSLLPDRPEDFLEWIAREDAVADDPEAFRPDGNLFPRRQVFGSYIASALAPYVETGAVRHRRALVVDVCRDGLLWRIADSQGGQVFADFLVIATSHPSPSVPGALRVLEGHHRFVPDSTRIEALGHIRPNDRLLIIGNGLTAADIVASLARTGHRGQITSISRRGLRSRGHSPWPQDPFGDFEATPTHSATALLRSIRLAITEAEAAGLTWHAVIDQVRTHGRALWQKLPMSERCRIVRHIRPFWDVHRFRIAPQVEDVLEQAIAEGRMEVLAASVGKVHFEGGSIHVALRRRSGPSLQRCFDAVIVTTGPAHGGILDSQAWLSTMRAQSHLQLDPTGLGIACSERSEALDADGLPDATLLVSGPLARGTFGELMGLPQITEHAVFVASELSTKVTALRMPARN
ncbi:FAD/NAD(P)-binding protein [Rhizobium sp. BK399]|uniref:FAD/NAD(P)-binding protein n=1 Tax=Rhizobium sp. BK399 TaxID=2587063 RepID=UPI0017BD1533|nr:FAD/NAD(P)-binding protein [Rhizobium sp. BK399]MBB3543155.1 putative NAD(P)/FAD-binding protein YdhS [Rhizobium sp. BK399]